MTTEHDTPEHQALLREQPVGERTEEQAREDIRRLEPMLT